MRRLRNIVEGITLLFGLIAPMALLFVVGVLMYSGQFEEMIAAIGLLCLFVMYKSDRIVDRQRAERELPAPPVPDQTKEKYEKN
jgi:hypothetical protein